MRSSRDFPIKGCGLSTSVKVLIIITREKFLHTAVKKVYMGNYNGKFKGHGYNRIDSVDFMLGDERQWASPSPITAKDSSGATVSMFSWKRPSWNFKTIVIDA